MTANLFDPAGAADPAMPTAPAAVTTAPREAKGERATERACQQTIVDAAHLLGYRVLAVRPGKSRRDRWTTPIQGDAGYPDLTLVHRNAGVLHVELKRAPNRVEPDQIAWGEALIAAGAVWRLVWVPEQMQMFVQELADRAMARTR